MVGELVANRAGDLIAQQIWIVAEVTPEGVAEDDDAVVRVVAADAVALVEPVGATAAPAVGDHYGDVCKRVAQQVGQVVERVADELLEVAVVERIELHEVAFVGIDGQSFAGQALGVADDFFELALGLRVVPAGHVHGDERHAAHQRGGDDHPQRDVLECPDGADRAEALPDDEHDQAYGHGYEHGHANTPKLGGSGRLRLAHHVGYSYLSVRAMTRRWISFVPS